MTLNNLINQLVNRGFNSVVIIQGRKSLINPGIKNALSPGVEPGLPKLKSRVIAITLRELTIIYELFSLIYRQRF